MLEYATQKPLIPEQPIYSMYFAEVRRMWKDEHRWHKSNETVGFVSTSAAIYFAVFVPFSIFFANHPLAL